MKKSYWLYKMCLLLGLGICIPVTGNASDIGDATLTQQQSKNNSLWSRRRRVR